MKACLCLIPLLLCSVKLQNSTLDDQVVSYCDSLNVSAYSNLSEQQMADMRASYSTPLKTSASKTVDAINSGNYASLMTGIIVASVFMFIFLFISIVIIFVYCGFCCCCDKEEKGSLVASRVCMFTALLFILGVLGLTIGCFIIAGNISNDAKNAECAFNWIQRDLINGNNFTNQTFIGLSSLNSVFSNLNDEVMKLPLNIFDLNTISRSTVNTATKAAVDSLSNFYGMYRTSTTSDGSGGKSQPTSISALTKGVYPVVQGDFLLLNGTAGGLVAAANEGNKLSDPYSMLGLKQTLKNINIYLTGVINDINDGFSVVTPIFSFTHKNSIYISIGVIVLGCLLLIFGIFLISILFCMSLGRLPQFRIHMKVMLVISAIVCAIMCAASVFFFFVSLITGTACEGMNVFSSTGDFNLLFSEWGIPTTNFSSILNVCVSLKGSGRIQEIFQSQNMIDAYTSVETFLNGFSQMNVLSQFWAGSSNSQGVMVTMDYWRNISFGLIFDQSNIKKTLSDFNQQISCENKSAQLNDTLCLSNQANCFGVFSKSNYSQPVCSSKAKSTFDSLKAYQADEVALMSNMTISINSSSNNPHQQYRNAFNQMVGLNKNSENVIKNLNKTFSTVNRLKVMFSLQTNCQVMRNELFLLESSICFGFSKTVFLFFVLITSLASALFVFNFLICCSMKYMPKLGHLADIKSDKINQIKFEFHSNSKNEEIFNDKDKTPLTLDPIITKGDGDGEDFLI